MLLVSQIKMRIDRNYKDLEKVIAKKLGVYTTEVHNFIVQKRSIDARKKDDIYFVYTVLVDVKYEERVLSKRLPNVAVYEAPVELVDYSKCNFDKDKKVAIIGFGPAGMFSALKFAESGVNVVVYERGEKVDERVKTIDKFMTDRILNKESNIQFGEGGAGTFSDGKLTNRKKDIRNDWLFHELVEAGAPKEILYVQNPHIGTDKLRGVVKSIRSKIISLGSRIYFNSKVTNIEKSGDGINLTVNNEKVYYDYVILAIGHSSRDTIEMIYHNKIDITSKPFAVGFRIEHKQTMVNKSQFGPNFDLKALGAAEYKLTNQTKTRGVYTFCMCPGGWVVPAASEEKMVAVNGMSEFKRDKVNANSALLVTVNQDDFKSDHPLAGIEFQRELERKAFVLGGSDYNAPIQTVGDFVDNKVSTKLGSVLPSYSIGYKFANLRTVFNEEINQAIIESLGKMAGKMRGFNNRDAVLTGVESRSSSPVRILRDKETYMSTNFSGLYPTGEGAGYAGGIVSAAVDGIKVSEKIMDLIKL